MLRQFLSALALLVAVGALPGGSFASELIPGAMINKPGGHDFMVEGLGKMKLASIKVNGQPSNDCLVDVPSVSRLIQEDVRNKSLAYEQLGADGIVVVITLQSTICEGNVVCCSSRGKGCAATIEIGDKKVAERMLN